MGNYDPGYTLTHFGKMLLNKPRVDAYLRAMREVIRPGDIVLEIGAGPGIFAMNAAKMGARKVIAIDCNPSIRLAERLVRHNNLEDRIKCIEGISTELRLDQPADVIISDLRGVLPLYSRHIPSIIDARNRLLAPSGALIARRDTLYAAPVESSDGHHRVTNPWEINEFGLNLSAGSTIEASRSSKVRLKSHHLLAEAKEWCTIDYQKVTEPSASGVLKWETEKSGILNGVAVWFDAELAPGCTFSNHPAMPELIYGQSFLPLQQPIAVQSQTQVILELSAHWVHKNYVWRWKGEIRDPGGLLIEKFDQSSLAGYLKPIEHDKSDHNGMNR